MPVAEFLPVHGPEAVVSIASGTGRGDKDAPVGIAPLYPFQPGPDEGAADAVATAFLLDGGKIENVSVGSPIRRFDAADSHQPAVAIGHQENPVKGRQGRLHLLRDAFRGVADGVVEDATDDGTRLGDGRPVVPVEFYDMGIQGALLANGESYLNGAP